MSTRHLLNMTIGAVATLLLAAIGIAFTTAGQGDEAAARTELAAQQQLLVQSLTQEADALVVAGDVTEANRARTALAHTIVQFDRTLTALLHGGVVSAADGRSLSVPAAENGRARKELEEGARLWIDTGLPLSDLAAGEYSVFSAAGRGALEGLDSNHVALMGCMADAAGYFQQSARARRAAGRYARWAIAGLALALAGLIWRRRQPPSAQPPTAPTDPVTAADETTSAAALTANGPIVESIFRRPSATDTEPMAVPLDFDSVNAAVDQMSVDMNTIAGSTDKMRLAIDSVGYALQGMLYSLREMAQDTAEGHKIVRGANNAATFTAATAEQLVASAREMAQVVARVTQLALKTKQVANQIEGEAIHTGKTGATFTTVVAGEVKGLAQQTNRATVEIDQTVGAILATSREYEEAIGQIIKNISQINKVSQNLGQLMLDPPPRVVPGSDAGAAAASLNAAVAPRPTETTTMMPPPDEPTAPADTQLPIEAETTPSTPEVAAEWQDDAVDPEPTLQEVAARTSDAITATATTSDTNEAEPAPAPADGDSNGSVFMLGTPRKRPSVTGTPPAAAEPEPEVATEPTIEPTDAPAAASASEPAAAAEPVAETTAAAEPKADGGSNKNVFMLNKTKLAAARRNDAEDETELTAATAATTESSTPQGAADNVYGLDMPGQQEDAVSATPDHADETDTDASLSDRADTVADEADDDAPDAVAEDTASETDTATADTPTEVGPNVFLLNKPE